MGLKVGISGYTPVLTFDGFVKVKAEDSGLQLVNSSRETSFFALNGEIISEFRIESGYGVVLNASISHRGLIALFELIEAYGKLISLLGVNRTVFVKTIWDE